MKISFLLFGIAMAGCNGCSRKGEVQQVDYSQVQSELIAANKAQHQQETARIEEFIASKKWPMKETATGLHYWIYEPTEGPLAVNGEIAVVSYTSSLLDGTVCYSTGDSSPAEFLIGQDNVESGIHEALLLMKSGERARLVLPSHLAFGFTGDMAKIPQNAALVYDIHLIQLK